MIVIEVNIRTEKPRSGVFAADAKESPLLVSQTAEFPDFITKRDLVTQVVAIATAQANLYNYDRDVPVKG